MEDATRIQCSAEVTNVIEIFILQMSVLCMASCRREADVKQDTTLTDSTIAQPPSSACVADEVDSAN